MKTILECKNLSKRYGRTQALSGINLSLKSGRIIGLLGPNGSGKTTLIKRIAEAIDYFGDFYRDFDRNKALKMLKKVNLDPSLRIKTLSKGNKEKVQLILVMSRRAKLYCLDEPIAGVDPAARDYILSTIINNYEPDATILLSTHLISDVENILDEVVFIQNGHIRMQEEVETIRDKEGKSVDDLFREVFKC